MASAKPKTELPLRARALRMLARREHSRQELQRKLAAYCGDSAEIADLLEDFAHRGWLSESRYVEQTVSKRRRRYGSQRIAHELREQGVAGEAIAGALAKLKHTEFETACAVWRRKFGKLPDNMTERGRQLRFMQGRGFALATVLRIIKQGGGDEDDT